MRPFFNALVPCAFPFAFFISTTIHMADFKTASRMHSSITISLKYIEPAYR
jgi:hypothetical protein